MVVDFMLKNESNSTSTLVNGIGIFVELIRRGVKYDSFSCLLNIFNRK